MGEKINISGKWYYSRQDNAAKFQAIYHIECPYIVRYYNRFEDSTGIHILTDWIDGTTLSEFTKKHKLTHREKKRINSQIALATNVLKSHNIHPENIAPDRIFITSLEHNAVIIC